MRNLKLAFRVLLRSPFVTAVAIISLALGIGTNTAIFSMMHELLLRPLPVQEPKRAREPGGGGPEAGLPRPAAWPGDCDVVFSYSCFATWNVRRVRSAGIAGHYAIRGQPRLPGSELERRRPPGLRIVLPHRSDSGRRPDASSPPDDDRAPGANFVAVLSHGYWRSHLGGRSGGHQLLDHRQRAVDSRSSASHRKDSTAPPSARRPVIYVPISMRAQMVARLGPIRGASLLLDLPLCPPEAGRFAGAGPGRHQRDLFADHQRR